MADANARLAWEQCEDRTLYLTLSLYIDRADIPESIASGLKLDGATPPLAEFQGTRGLREAMDPLFNDVANRERLGRVEDYLIDVEGPPDGERLTLVTPQIVSWTTEGTTYKIDLGVEQAREARVRRFWYVHMNGAISYHVGLAMTYEHEPADLYAISMLQKAAAPKEFKKTGAGASNVYSGATGLMPLDTVLLVEPGGARRTFWAFVADRFERDARQLFAHICPGDAAAQKAASFATLVRHDPFLESPGLSMPRARFMFFFQDEKFFEALLPPPAPDANGLMANRRRIDCVPTAAFERYPEDIQAMIDAAKAAPRAPNAPVIVDIPLTYIQGIDDAHLRYLFLAGFNQNIIDFLNQDASEVLDSTDPIYPETEDQAEEAFFVRYANPRSLTTYVKRSRSLETGNDWIGTCPYAFLIHVMALHNEYVVRAYEGEAQALVAEVHAADERGELREAAEKFYKFRKKQFSDYMRNRYQNVFRYDTEKDAFAAVEKLRGVAKNVAYLEVLVDGVEKQTRDLEERLKEDAKDEAAAAREREEKISRRDSNRLTYLLALLSIGGFLFEFVAKLADFRRAGIHFEMTEQGLRLQNATPLDYATMGVMGLIFAFLVLGVVLFVQKKI